MAKLTEREVVILVKALGLDKAISGFDKLDSSIKKTQKTSGELDRNMKGTANITSNTTKAFAKQAQGLGGLVHVYATVAANVFALSSAFNVLKSNADLKIMEQASRQLSIASGTNFNLVAKSLKEVTGGAISMKEAMQTATLGLRGGATSTQLQQITDVATKAAKALGRSVPEAVTRLTQAVIKGEPELADEFGIILRVEEATKKYAATLGKTVSSLTTFERQQAIINQAIEQGTKKYGELKLDTNPYDKLAATFSELTQKILQFISTPIGAFFSIFAENTNLMVIAILAFAKAVAQRALPEIFKLGNAMINKSKEAAANAIAAYQAEQIAIENLIKSKEKLAAVSSFKSTQAKGTVKELGVVNNIPGIKKAIEANLGPGEIARAFYKSLYSQIDREAKKFGGDVSKVIASSIRNPIQREFLLLQQEYLKIGKGLPKDAILGQLRGVDITKEQFLALRNIIKVYSLELDKGVKGSVALENANRALAASGLNLGHMFDSIKLKTSGVSQGFSTFKVAMQVASQEVIAGTMKNLNYAESLALLKLKLTEAGIQVDKLNPRMLELGLTTGKFTGSIAAGIAKLGSWIGSAFNAIMVVTLLWEGIKLLADWIGITNAKVSEITNSLVDFQKDLTITTDAIYAYKKSINEASIETLSLQSAIESLGRRAAIFDSLAVAANKFAEKLRAIAAAGGDSRFWKVLSIFGMETDTKTEAAKAFKTQLAQATEMLGGAPKILSDAAGKLVTPGEIIDPMLKKMMTVTKWGVSASNIAEATKGLLNSAYEAAGGVIVDQSGKLNEKFLFHMNAMIKNDSAYKIIADNYGEFVKTLEESGANAVLAALDEIEAGTVIQNVLEQLNDSTTLSPDLAYKMEALTKIIRDAETAAGNFANTQKSGLEDFASGIVNVSKDLDNYIKNFSAGTEAAVDKSSYKVIEMASKLQDAISKIPDNVDPFKYLMDKAPEVTKFFDLTEQNANTAVKAQETLAKYAIEQLAALNKQSTLQAELTAAEVQLGIAKRNNALVDSKNFEEKKKATQAQFDAEAKVLDKQIEIQEEQVKIIAKRNQELVLIAQSILDLEKKRIAEQNIVGVLAEQLILRAQGDLLQAQGKADAAKAAADAELAALREKRAALDAQRGQALGNIDRKAASAGESAADKAQKQAEKIANLEASIAKKRLESASMFLALEKELGDAVESRMEWELTGAREAVALGSKRIAILGRELSMQAALVPMKKAVMEAEAHALEVKAAGLEKDGELKAAEEARLEVANKRQEMNNLDIEYITMRLEYEQKLYDIALKQHDLRKRAMIPTFKEGSGIQGSEEFFQTAKVEFALRWDKFLDEMTTPVDRLLDAFEGVVNSGVDAFVEAIANGENALQAAGDAIKQTMFELAKEWLKEDIKNLIYSTVGSFLGMEDPKDALKNELLKQTQQQKTQHIETINRMDVHTNKFDGMINLLGQINSKSGVSSAGNMQQQIPALTDALFGMTKSQYDSVSSDLDGLFSSMPDVFGSGMSNVSNTVSSGFSMLGTSIGGLGTILGGILLMSSNIFGSNKEVKDAVESKETEEELPMYAKNLEEQRKIDAAKLNGTLDKQTKNEEESNNQLLKAGAGIATILGSLYLSNSDIFKTNTSVNSSINDLTSATNKTGSDILSQLGSLFSLQSDSSKNTLALSNNIGSLSSTPEFSVQPINTLGIESAIYGSNNNLMNSQLGLFDSLSNTFSDSTGLQVDTLNNVINAQNNTSNNIVWKLEELNASQNSNFNSLLSSQDSFFNNMGGLVNFDTPSIDQNVIDTSIPNETINELGYNNNILTSTFEYKIDSLVASNTELNSTLANNQTELLDFLSSNYENNMQSNTPLSTDQDSFYSVIDTLTTEQTGVFEEATNQFTDVFSVQNDTMETVQKDLNTTFSTTNTNLSGTFTMHEQTFTQISDAFLAKLNSISTNGQGGFGSGISSGLDSMFGMTQGQYNNVSTGLEDMFNQQSDIFGSNAGISGQLDSLFASQPDVFGATTPGYASAFGASPSFGMGGLGTSFMNMFGTMPTMPTQPLGSGDIFSGSNPLSMSPGSMLNMAGMGGIMAPFQSMTQGIAGMGQSLMGGMAGGMAQPMAGGMAQPMAGGMAQPMAGGMMGGLSSGLGMSSMMMSMIPMMMGGIGGGSPAGQAAKEKAGSGSSSSDASLGGGDSEDVVEELKDTTEEMKDEIEKLLSEIKDNIIEIKINAIDFQIEHMEKIDKNFQVWLATFQLAHMQDLMILQSMATSLMSISMSNSIHTQYLAQIAGCTCQGGMGMAKGGIVSGMIRGYAKGAITTGPELAMIGEGTKREAIVPLPDNRSIPVTLTNDEEKEKTIDNRPINITINGVEGTEKGLRRSAAQIAYEVNRTSRNKVMRY